MPEKKKCCFLKRVKVKNINSDQGVYLCEAFYYSATISILNMLQKVVQNQVCSQDSELE